MEKFILQNESSQDRLQALKDNCQTMEPYSYHKAYDEEGMQLQKDELIAEDIQLSKLMAEKKETVRLANLEIKRVKLLRDALIANVRSGGEEVTEDVFLMDDQDEGKMGYYNSEGVLLSVRPLQKNERQLRMVSNKTGTNN